MDLIRLKEKQQPLGAPTTPQPEILIEGLDANQKVVEMKLGNTLIYIVPPEESSEEKIKKVLVEVEKALWVIVDEIHSNKPKKS